MSTLSPIIRRLKTKDSAHSIHTVSNHQEAVTRHHASEDLCSHNMFVEVDPHLIWAVHFSMTRTDKTRLTTGDPDQLRNRVGNLSNVMRLCCALKVEFYGILNLCV
jgi:transcriptional regulator of heat shock response